MKRVFALLFTVLRVSVNSFFFLAIALLVVLATPFWLVELFSTPAAFKTATLARLGPDESALEWVYTLRDPRGWDPKTNFVRLWGIEFRYA